ncbi:MAG: VWA domain-containing protein, partial [Nannocystaceae bacterium]|nr:VWA domain-containing protein [Nannocystaceae bacterium]
MPGASARYWLILGAPALLCGHFGCGEPPREETLSGSVDSPTNGATSGSGDTVSNETSEPGDGESEDGLADSGTGEPSTDGGLKLDVGTQDDLPVDAGCTAVDLLFVIDNSGSMCGYQSNLAQTLPDFVTAIFDALPPDTSVHLGITTTSFSSGGTHQEQNCMSVQGATEIEAAYTTPAEGVEAGNGYQGRLLE